MSDCVNVEVREALPDLLNNRLGALDTATMKAHVESCPNCRAELELLRDAKMSALLVPKMDSAKIAAAIAAYPRVPTTVTPAPRPLIQRFNALRIAAVAAIVATAGLVWSNSSRDTTVPAEQVAMTPVPAVAETIPSPSPEAPAVQAPRANNAAGETRVASISLVGGTSDLSDSDLEKLVSDLEQIEPLPSEEPQSVTSTVEDIGSDEDSGL